MQESTPTELTMKVSRHRRCRRLVYGLAACAILVLLACSRSSDVTTATHAPASSAPQPPAAAPAPVALPSASTQLEEADVPAVLAKVENPRIVEARGAMDHFYTRLAQVVRGTSDRPLRIAIYGDSNMTMDYISGSLRRTLQN